MASTHTNETISPQTWRRLFERLASSDIDWEWLADQLDRGCTGKLEIDLKDGQARGGRVLMGLGRSPPGAPPRTC